MALHTGRRVGPEDVNALRAFEGVVLATGVVPVQPNLPGVTLPHVLDYAQAFAESQSLGPRIAVIGGGGIAVDLAHRLTAEPGTKSTPEDFLALHAVTMSGAATASARLGPSRTARRGGREVTLMRRGRTIGQGIGPSTRWVVMGELRSVGVRMLTGVTCQEITPDGVVVRDAEGERLVAADHVVLAVGQRPVTDLVALLRAAGVPFVAAGGAAGTQGLNAVRATAEGLRAAHHVARMPAG